jgi:hypothetical protein
LQWTNYFSSSRGQLGLLLLRDKQGSFFEARILRECQFHIKHLREIIAFSVNQEEQSPRSLQWTSGALAIGVKLARLLSRDDQGSLMPGF